MASAYNGVKTASQLSADIEAIDLASQKGGGTGTHYSITLASGGVTLTEAADVAAINLKGADTLTINGQGGALSGADKCWGLFVYSGNVTIEGLTIENAVAKGGAGSAGSAGGGGGAGLGGVAGSRDVGACEHRKPAKVLSRLLRRLGDDRNLQAPADCLSDLSKRHAFFCDRVITGSGGTLLKRQSIEMGGIEPVHRGPAVEPVADIGRDTLLAGNSDQVA